jgi:hypothetical protein
MGQWLICSIVGGVFGLSPMWAYSQEELPFWRLKPKLEKQIIENRKIVVSVDADTQGRASHIRMVGVGAVNVPLYFAVEQIQRFEELTQVSSYFKKVKHDKEKKEVYFHIQALGQQIRFIQKYQWGPRTSEAAQMDWKITWGKLDGMVGHYKMRQISPMKTEIAIWASMKKLDIPLPEFLVNFTLEVIAEKTAQKMRTFIEKQFRDTRTIRENYVEAR